MARPKKQPATDATNKVVDATEKVADTATPLVKPQVVSLFSRTGREQDNIHHITVPEPRMGAKSFFIEKKGIYVLETGPCVLRSLSCTYVGTGTFMVRDGVPSEAGHFDADRLDPFSDEYMLANGRRVYVMSPQAIGFWGLDAGLHHGLTIVASGGDGPVMVTVCWLKIKAKPKVELITDE